MHSLNTLLTLLYTQTDLLQRFQAAQAQHPDLVIEKVAIGTVDVTELLETLNRTNVSLR